MIPNQEMDAPSLEYWRRYSLPPMSHADTLECFRSWRQDGNARARERIIRANARFAISIAAQYAGGRRTMDELVADAMSGLLRASDSFDPATGFRFISYAVHWVRQYCSVGTMEGRRAVHYPVNVYGEHRQVERAIVAHVRRTERMPEDAEVAQATGMSEDRVAVSRSLTRRDTHIDAPIAGMDDLTIVDGLADTAPSQADELEMQEMSEVLEAMLGDLDPKPRHIIVRYYGLDGRPTETLESIAERLHLTRERIRQLRDRGIAMMQIMHGASSRDGYANRRAKVAAAIRATTSTGAAAHLLGVSRGYLLALARRFGVEVPNRGAAGDCLAAREAERTAARVAEVASEWMGSEPIPPPLRAVAHWHGQKRPKEPRSAPQVSQ